MSKKIWKIKVEVMMKRHAELSFPEFIKDLRVLLGFSRKGVAQDTGISYTSLVTLEKGYFSTLPDEGVIQSLSDYYDLPVGFLKAKVVEFVSLKTAEKSQKKYKSFMEAHPEYYNNPGFVPPALPTQNRVSL